VRKGWATQLRHGDEDGTFVFGGTRQAHSRLIQAKLGGKRTSNVRANFEHVLFYRAGQFALT
jgi:hypothetical protein